MNCIEYVVGNDVLVACLIGAKHIIALFKLYPFLCYQIVSELFGGNRVAV